MTGDLATTIQQRFPQRVIATHGFRGQETALIKREGLVELARFLRDDPAMRFDFLMDLTCVDYLTFGTSQSSAPTLTTPSPLPYYMNPKPVTEIWTRLHAPPVGGAQAGGVSDDESRFDVVYHFYSSSHHHRLRVKVPVTSADPVVDSLTELWHAANWFEREVWDMFGIRFTGHPNLKRILMYEGFSGHPLRKDYPIRKRQPLIGPLN
jgi:NADH-quinone oxidoreductase subunit C